MSTKLRVILVTVYLLLCIGINIKAYTSNNVYINGYITNGSNATVTVNANTPVQANVNGFYELSVPYEPVLVVRITKPNLLCESKVLQLPEADAYGSQTVNSLCMYNLYLPKVIK